MGRMTRLALFATPVAQLSSHRVELLDAEGVLQRRDGRIVPPGDGTVGAVWREWIGRTDVTRTSAAAFDRVRRMQLLTGGREVPDHVLLQVREVEAPRPVTLVAMMRHLGMAGGKENLARLRALTGETRALPNRAEMNASPAALLKKCRLAWFLKVGALRRVDGKVVFPGDGTVGAIWDDWIARPVEKRGGAEFKVLRRMRTLTGAGPLMPDAVLMQLVDWLGLPAITNVEVGRQLGLDAAKVNLARIRILTARALMAGTRAGVAATSAARMGRRRRRELLALGALEEVGGEIRFPGDGTLGAIWRDWIGRDIPRKDKSAFDTVRLMQMLTGVGDWVPDSVLLQLVECVAPRRISAVLLARWLGKARAKENLARIGDLTGQVFTSQSPVRCTATRTQLLAELPGALRKPFRRLFARRKHPPILDPNGKAAARALAIRGGLIRTLTILRLLEAAAERRHATRQREIVSQGERWSVVVPAGSELDAEAVEAAFASFMRGEVLPSLRPAVRARAACGYLPALAGATRLLATLDPLSRTPVPLPAAVAGAVFQQDACAAARGSADDQDAETLGKMSIIAPRLFSMLAAAENRTALLEGLSADVALAFRKGRGLISRGVAVDVFSTSRALRADGSLGEGVQTVHVRLMTEAAMVRDALARSPDDPELSWRAGLAARPAFARNRKVPKSDPSRLHLVYVGTTPAEAGGECAEPFFAELFRWALLEPERNLSPAFASERVRRAQALRTEREPRMVAGMLTDPPSRRAAVDACRKAYPEGEFVVLPLVPFLHAMATARIALRFGIRWGARLGETMQLRRGTGCVGRHFRGARYRNFVQLRPKGWSRWGKFGVDEGTLKALKRLERLARARFHPDAVDEQGRPSLPVCRFGAPTHRPRLPAARYILIGGRGALDYDQLVYFTRVLLTGVLDLEEGQRLDSYDSRYLFAIALGLLGSSYEETGELLHHLPGSKVSRRYDLSGAIFSDEAAERFNELTDAGLIGQLGDD